MASQGTSTSGQRGKTQTGSAPETVGTINALQIYYESNTIDYQVATYLTISLGSFLGALLVWRFCTLLNEYVRTVSCLEDETQRYFARNSRVVSWFKKNVLYAPIFRKRHNRQIQLNSAVSVGTLPTRLQLSFIICYLLTNVVCCVVNIDWTLKPAFVFYDVIRNRAGTMAAFNLVPLFLTAGRNNLLISLLGISFDTFNLIHRWLGRIIILEVIVHAVLFLVADGDLLGSVGVAGRDIFKLGYLTCGFIACLSFLLINIQALSVFRRAFYEAFKLVHIGLSALAIGALYNHLQLQKYWELVYLYPVIALWGFDHAARAIRLTYANLGAGGSRALVEALPDNSCRITVTMARSWPFKPGQHAYLYVPSISYWQSHPFSIAWTDEAEQLDCEKLPTDRRDIISKKKTTVSFLLRSRTGFTKNLYTKAAASKDGQLITQCLVEGPYGAISTMSSYGTVVFFAGGVGITDSLSHVRYLLEQRSHGKVATRRVVLIWIIQGPDHFKWFRSWIAKLLSMEKSGELLRVMIFVSSQKSIEEFPNPVDNVQVFPGRPDIDIIIGNVMESQVGALGVSVCGPGSLSDEVRRAVRERQYQGAIDFVDESYSY